MQKNNLVISENQVRALSKNQKLFNQLVVKIDKLKKEKILLIEKLKEVEIMVHKKIAPLVLETRQSIIDLIIKVDIAYDTYKLSNKEQEAVSWFLVTQLEDILASEGVEEEKMDKLKTIFNKHSDESFEEMQEGEASQKKNLFESLDLDIDYEAFQNLDEDDMEEILRKKVFGAFGMGEEKPRKKTKKQLEAEAKEAEAEAKMKKDARSIYTQLAKLLHPDKEMDEVRREEKSEIMKRVTNAYSENDLYELLQIQLEVEQLSEDKLAATDDGLMESYINVLKKQREEIQSEINQTQSSHPLFRQFFDYTGRFIESRFKKQLKEVKDAQKSLKETYACCNSQLQFKDMAKDLIHEKKQAERMQSISFFDF